MRGFIKQCVRLSLWCSLMSLMLAASVHAVILEGVGHASIHDDDLASARAEARNAAMRDLALQYEAQVNTSDTMENGVLTQSRMRLASSAKARNVKVIDEHRSGNLLRVTVRGDISAGTASCEGGEAARLKKRVAVTGFPLLYPDQARVGRIDDAGEILPQLLQQGLRETGSLQVFSTTSTRLFADLLNAPTMQEGGNRLTNVIQVAREMGVQFVVTGVIRDIGVADPAAWGSGQNAAEYWCIGYAPSFRSGYGGSGWLQWFAGVPAAFRNSSRLECWAGHFCGIRLCRIPENPLRRGRCRCYRRYDAGSNRCPCVPAFYDSDYSGRWSACDAGIRCDSRFAARR